MTMTTVASLTFLGFLLASAVVFYVFPVKFRWIALLISSVAFYVIAGSFKFLPFIVLTSLAVWVAAVIIGKMNERLACELSEAELDKSEKKKLKEKCRKKTRAVLVLCLLLCIGILFVTKFAKYAVYFVNNIIASRGDGRLFGTAWIVVPLGISYYTFSTVGYLLDVYWKRYPYEKNPLRFFLYAIYFPHILQGPISRYNLLGKELKRELRFDGDRVIAGVQLMIWGFFKKLVIADRLNVFIHSVYDGSPHPGSIFLVTMVFDAIMIYTDFSGYMDIVRGASQIFGVELEQNFNHPFFSKSVSEFWRRWHMSLGSWFKDYVYYP
ncbi:MAG: MBOAT family protein, partial [Clostridia bacterium]|nr:MBOAT family protein [Clostridia bacterium]